MKRIAFIGIIWFAACRTVAPVAEAPPSPPDAFAAIEAALVDGERVERMHRDGEAYVALLAAGESYRLVRVQQRAGTWAITETTQSTADYLWPEQ